MFVGRAKELAELESIHDSDTFQMPVVYGRRRVGKTRLLTKFIEDKRAVYFQARRTNAEANLSMLSQAILSKIPGASGANYQSFDEAFDALGQLASEERLVVVIDEFPYLAYSFPEISSLLQEKIDHSYAPNSKLMLILCGSSLSFMEEQVLGYESPLYGRRTAQLKIEPLDFLTSLSILGDMPREDAAVCYGITGGVPAYLEKLDTSASLEENIKRLFLDPAGYLYEEPSNLMLQECRDPKQYDAIVQAIGNGNSKIAQIANATGIAASNAKLYLDKLISLGIVERELPLNETSNKKAIYKICDQMFRFWYRFLPQNMGLVQNDLTDAAYARIKPHLSDYMGEAFELICKQFIFELARRGELPVLPVKTGRWWGTDARTKSQEEIDLLIDDGEGSLLLGECKWRNEPAGEKVLKELVRKSELFQRDSKQYTLFSKRGFTDACQQLAAQRGDTTLWSFEHMCEYAK